MTEMPSPAPRKADSFTSPMPRPRGYTSTIRKSTRPAPSALRIHSRLGIVDRAQREHGECSGEDYLVRNQAVLEVRASDHDEDPAEQRRRGASSVKPKTRPQAPPSAAVPRSTSTRRGERGTRRSSGSWSGAFVAIRSASGLTSTPGRSPDESGSEVHPAEIPRSRVGLLPPLFPPPGDPCPSFWGRCRFEPALLSDVPAAPRRWGRTATSDNQN